MIKALNGAEAFLYAGKVAGGHSICVNMRDKEFDVAVYPMPAHWSVTEMRELSSDLTDVTQVDNKSNNKVVPFKRK
jgi:hypothetical protein